MQVQKIEKPSGWVVEWFKALFLKTILLLSYINGSVYIFQAWSDNVDLLINFLDRVF